MKDSTDLFQFIASIIKDMPKRSKSEHQIEFEKMILDPLYSEFLHSAVRRVFNLEYARALASVFPPSLTELKARTMARTEKRTAGLAEDERETALAKSIITGNMLNMMMANGKKLGDCTGIECQNFGGFFTEIGQKVGNKIVRKVMNKVQIDKMAATYFGVVDKGGKTSAIYSKDAHA